MVDMITYLVWAIQESLQQMDQPLNLEKDILLFSSHGENKRSYHLVVNNYCHSDCDEANRFYRVVINKMPEFFRRWIDHTVYKSLQQFRMEGSQKVGSGRIKRLIPTWIYGYQYITTNLDFHVTAIDQLNDDDKRVIWADQSKARYATLHAAILTNTYYCTVLPDFAALLPLEDTKLPAEYNGGVTDDRALAAIQILAEGMGCSMYSSKFPFRFSKVVAGGLIILKRNLPSYCDVCERRHENENPFIYIVKGNVFFDCRRHPDGLRKKVGYIPEEDDTLISSASQEEASASDPSPEELSTMTFTVPTVDFEGRVISSSVSSASLSSASLSSASVSSSSSASLSSAILSSASVSSSSSASLSSASLSSASVSSSSSASLSSASVSSSSSLISSSSVFESKNKPDMFRALETMARGVIYQDGKAQIKNHRFIKQVPILR
jgi:hypothetical protein